MSRVPVEALSALLKVSLHDASFHEVMQRLVEIAKETLGADDVSTTLVRGDEPFTASHTGPLALEADEMQYERGYGPCIDAGISGTLLLIEDTATESRWPDYMAKVRKSGVGSSMSVPIPAQVDVVGALNCYWRDARVFTEEEKQLAFELANYLAVVLANSFTHAQAADAAQQMREAMESRATIEQAKGIVIAQRGCTADEAFDMLRSISQGKNLKLREVAENLLAEAVRR